MKKLKLFVSILMTIALFGGMSSVYAANGVISNSTTNSQITLSRSITNCKQKITSNTFGYTVTADPSNPSGGASNMPTAASVVFSNVNPSSNTCTASGTLSLTGATFSVNGDYTYTVQESSSTDAASYPVDTTNKYTIKISVRNATTTDFTSAKIVTILLYTGTGESATKKSDNTTFTFTSTGASRSVTLTNTVEGNMADPDLYFPIVVTITDAVAGDSYTISGQSSGSGATACTVATGQTSCTATLMLKHNETATISGLRNGVSVAFSETKTSGTEPAKYTTEWNGSSAGDSLAPFVVNSNQEKTVKNTYNEPVITGVILKYLPYVLIVALAVAAVVFLILKNRKKDENDVVVEEETSEPEEK